MKRFALALALVAMASACKKAEQTPAQSQMTDTTHMMGDTTKMQMSDTTKMMGDTTKH